MQQIRKDIFISCRYDGSGNQFASRLCQDLEALGYSVYYDANESYAHSFPEHIREAVIACKDFILIISAGCLERLIRNDPVDWVRDEILTARNHDKPIIPILMENVSFPADAEIMPESLQFLPHIPAIKFPEHYIQSPFSILVGKLNAGQDGGDVYKDVFNSNPSYSVHADYEQTLAAAQNSDVKAMYEMGMMGFYGVTDAKGLHAGCDYEQAAYWLKKVAETDDSMRFHALSMLGRMYYQGSIPREPQSYEKSFAYHCEAAQHDIHSVSSTGFLLRTGVGCAFDFCEVEDYYRDYASRTNNLEQMEYAKFLARYGKYQQAYAIYESMETNVPEASYQMGVMCRDGVLSDPPQPDYFRAAYYLQDAADRKHIQAAYEFGILCFRPSGRFRKDFWKAQKYLKIAADGGMADAQYVLGYMYWYGHVEKKTELALEYLKKAYAQGHGYASVELANIYQTPEYCNYQQAYECAKCAADASVSEGELILGNLLFFGRGCEPDMNKAYEMYEKAYRQGVYYALIMMKKIERIRKNSGYV